MSNKKTNLELILEEFEELKGQHVINEMHKVERLVAIGTDDDDYYYITYDGTKLNWNTCVGRIIPLKNKLDDQHYNELERLSNLNFIDRLIEQYPSADLTIDSYKVDLMKDWGENDRLLTDIIFKYES